MRLIYQLAQTAVEAEQLEMPPLHMRCCEVDVDYSVRLQNYT